MTTYVTVAVIDPFPQEVDVTGTAFTAHQYTVCGYGLLVFIPPSVSSSAVEHHCNTRDLSLVLVSSRLY